LNRQVGGLLAVDLANIINKALEGTCEAYDGCGMTGVKRASYNRFQQPYAERIEFTRTGHVDRQWLGFLDTRRNQIGQAFQSSSMNSCPGTAWAQDQCVNSGCLTQQGGCRRYSLERSGPNCVVPPQQQLAGA
jgi:hypothetical protein